MAGYIGLLVLLDPVLSALVEVTLAFPAVLVPLGKVSAVLMSI